MWKYVRNQFHWIQNENDSLKSNFLLFASFSQLTKIYVFQHHRQRDNTYRTLSESLPCLFTVEQQTLAGWPSPASGALQASGPWSTCWDGKGKGPRIAPQKLSRVHGFQTLVAAQAAKKGGGYLAALSCQNLWLSCCVGLFMGTLWKKSLVFWN